MLQISGAGNSGGFGYADGFGRGFGEGYVDGIGHGEGLRKGEYDGHGGNCICISLSYVSLHYSIWDQGNHASADGSVFEQNWCGIP
jgi:hypothetical protein